MDVVFAQTEPPPQCRQRNWSSRRWLVDSWRRRPIRLQDRFVWILMVLRWQKVITLRAGGGAISRVNQKNNPKIHHYHSFIGSGQFKNFIQEYDDSNTWYYLLSTNCLFMFTESNCSYDFLKNFNVKLKIQKSVFLPILDILASLSDTVDEDGIFLFQKLINLIFLEHLVYGRMAW